MTSLHLVLAIFALMLGFGLLMVLSSSSVAAFRSGGSSFSVFANQATYAGVGLDLPSAAPSTSRCGSCGSTIDRGGDHLAGAAGAC